jgi:hypothetical protein
MYSKEGEAKLDPKGRCRRTTMMLVMVMTMVRQLEKRMLLLSLLPPLLRI